MNNGKRGSMSALKSIPAQICAYEFGAKAMFCRKLAREAREAQNDDYARTNMTHAENFARAQAEYARYPPDYPIDNATFESRTSSCCAVPPKKASSCCAIS